MGSRGRKNAKKQKRMAQEAKRKAEKETKERERWESVMNDLDDQGDQEQHPGHHHGKVNNDIFSVVVPPPPQVKSDKEENNKNDKKNRKNKNTKQGKHAKRKNQTNAQDQGKSRWDERVYREFPALECKHLFDVNPEHMDKLSSQLALNKCKNCEVCNNVPKPPGKGKKLQKYLAQYPESSYFLDNDIEFGKGANRADGTLFMCLSCCLSNCGPRSIHQHGRQHWMLNPKHRLALNVKTLKVFCFQCNGWLIPPHKGGKEKEEGGADSEKQTEGDSDNQSTQDTQQTQDKGDTTDTPVEGDLQHVDDTPTYEYSPWDQVAACIKTVDDEITLRENKYFQTRKPASNANKGGRKGKKLKRSNKGKNNRYRYDYTDVQFYEGDMELGVKGLANLGNTCFFNSAIQVLIHSYPLRNHLLTLSLSDDKQELSPEHQVANAIVLADCLQGSYRSYQPVFGFPHGLITSDFSSLMNRVWLENGRYDNPKELFSSICLRVPKFRGFHQQDAHELLRTLLNIIHVEEARRIKTHLLDAYKLEHGETEDTVAVPEEVVEEQQPTPEPESTESTESNDNGDGDGEKELTQEELDEKMARELAQQLNGDDFMEQAQQADNDEDTFDDISDMALQSNAMMAQFLQIQESGRKKAKKNKKKKKKVNQFEYLPQDAWNNQFDDGVASGTTETTEEEDWQQQLLAVDETVAGDQVLQFAKNGNARVQSFIDTLFTGQMVSVIECQTCQSKYERPEDYMDLSVPLPWVKVAMPSFGSSKSKKKKKSKSQKKLHNEAKWAQQELEQQQQGGGGKNKNKKKKNKDKGYSTGGFFSAEEQALLDAWEDAKEQSDSESEDEDDGFEDQNLSMMGLEGAICGESESRPIENAINASVMTPVILDLAESSEDDDSAAQGWSFHGAIDADTSAVEPRKDVGGLERTSSGTIVLGRTYEASENEHSVNRCLGEFTRMELLNGDNAYACEQCCLNANDESVRREATKQTLLKECPPILTIHLNRFLHNGVRFDKIGGHVQFQETVNMGRFTVSGDDKWYRLYGVIVHQGGMGGGHYVCYVRASRAGVALGNGESSDGNESEKQAKEQWYLLSDSHVSKATLETVLQAEAFMLFYEQVEDGAGSSSSSSAN